MDESKIFERYYNLALRFLSYRPRSKKEIVDYLNKKIKKLAITASNAADAEMSTETSADAEAMADRQNEIETQKEAIITKIMQRLIELKFIDDRVFAEFWIEQRTKFKHKPIWVIERELRQKGIDSELIKDEISKFDESKTADLESAKKLAEKKLDFYRSLSPVKRREKVINFLLRKGFSYDTVKKALN